MSNPARILIVEDEHLISQAIERQLDRMGYIVVGICGSAKEVLDLIKEEEEIDLILLDILLEGSEDGIDLAGKLRDLYHIPHIFLTGTMDDETLERAKETEPLGYISKPFTQRDLRATLELVLYRLSADKRLAQQEVQIQSLIDSMNQGYCLLDSEFKIIYANQKFAELLGITVEHLLGINVKELGQLHEDVYQSFTFDESALMNGLETEKPFELTLYSRHHNPYLELYTDEENDQISVQTSAKRIMLVIPKAISQGENIDTGYFFSMTDISSYLKK
jgi:CheY-like chemotaxis protein